MSVASEEFDYCSTPSSTIFIGDVIGRKHEPSQS